MANRILIGDRLSPDYEFQPDSFRDGSISFVTAVDIIGSEMAVDEMSVTVEHDSGAYILFAPSDYDAIMSRDYWLLAGSDQVGGDLTQVPYGTPVWLMNGTTVRAKLYWREAVRVGRTTYKIRAVSAVGLLDGYRHMGGIYRRATVAEVLTDIIGDLVPYTVDSDVAGQLVGGWLPIDTRRANLHKLAFALGINIRKDAAGDMVFTFINNATELAIPERRIYAGARVEYNTPATAVEVAEHTFSAVDSEPEKVLFDNTSADTADHLLVEFEEPVHSLRVEWLTLEESGDNYAIVSGNGLIYGKPYYHDTQTVRLETVATGTRYEVPSRDDGLVNSVNSENVARRLLAYYSGRKTEWLTIKQAVEKAGEIVTFADPHGEQVRGIVTQSRMRLTNSTKAELKIIQGYTPGQNKGNIFTTRDLITASGSYTFRKTGRARIILVGGGTGGQGGYDGEDGFNDLLVTSVEGTVPGSGNIVLTQLTSLFTSPREEGGAGGKAGEGGESGKVLVLDLQVTAGQTVTLNIGVGGAGGARNGAAGAAGTATTMSGALGNYSSDDGINYPGGYNDVLGGLTLGAPGADGYDGGAGGACVDPSGGNGDGTAGESVHGYDGGAGGVKSTWIRNDQKYYASGGGGGGGAYGGVATAGEDGSITRTGTYNANALVVGGRGGSGANATAPAKGAYGSGGTGGHGGGGGGNVGGEIATQDPTSISDYLHTAVRDAGVGGLGSVGGEAGDGCGLILQ